MDVQWLLNLPQQINGGEPLSKTTLALKAGDLLTGSVLEVDKGRDALLSFGQFRAYARLPLPVVTGQRIQIQVQPADPGLRMVMVPNRTGQPASILPTGDRPPAGGGQPAGPMPQPAIGNNTASSEQSVANALKNDNLQIRLFEPVSDRPFLSAHSHMLHPGSSIEGRITGFRKDGMMLVDFGRFKAFAKIDVPVREGQRLPLTVVRTGRDITLAVDGRAASGASRQGSSPLAPQWNQGVSSTAAGHTAAGLASAAIARKPAADVLSVNETGGLQPSMAQASRSAPGMMQLMDQIQQLLGRHDLAGKLVSHQLPPTPQAALTHLQQLLHPVSATGDPLRLMASIRSFVENSGVYFEKRVEDAIRSVQDPLKPMPISELAQQPQIRELMVKDLKPNLLVLNQFLEKQILDENAGERHILETMKSMVQRTLAHIEQQQLGATEKPVNSDLFQAFSHLLLLADNRRDARLKVYYANKGRRDNENRTPRVALLLEMDRMGTVRTDLWMVGRDLNITFFVQSAETRAAISDMQHEIKTGLAKTFNTVAVSVVVSEKKIEQFDTEDLNPAHQRLLDLNI